MGRSCIAEALKLGAQQVRVSLGKSVSDIYAMRNGELDGVTHTADCSISFGLYVDGRKGVFSTNRLEEDSLKRFLKNAVASTRLLAVDKDFRLPDPARYATNATEGTEMGLFDENYFGMTDEKRLEMARRTSLPQDRLEGEDWKVVNYECEYMDSISDNLLMDSQGLFRPKQ